MGFRFRKTIRIAKGVNLNLSKRGVNASIGIPGTGIRWTTSKGRKRKGNRASGGGCGSVLLIFLLAIGFWIWATGGKVPEPQRPSLSQPVPFVPSAEGAAPVPPPHAKIPADSSLAEIDPDLPDEDPGKPAPDLEAKSGHSAEFEANIRQSIKRRHERERNQNRAKGRARADAAR